MRAIDSALALLEVSRPGSVHHSDGGSTHASDDYRRALERHELVASMSRKNAPAGTVSPSNSESAAVAALAAQSEGPPKRVKITRRDVTRTMEQ